MKNLLTTLQGLALLISASAIAAEPTIDPSHAFASALTVAERKAREGYKLESDYRIYEAIIATGKFEEKVFGEYTVQISFSSLVSTPGTVNCTVPVRISRGPYAKQPPGVVVLEEVINSYQIIAKGKAACDGTPEK